MARIAWIVTLVLIAGALAGPARADKSARKLYKWTDKSGQVHYGDQIPPEYASEERQVINTGGVEVDRLEAQKTPEQVAVEEQKDRDQIALQQRDHNLLITYASVQEIERLRDQRVSLVQDQIRVTTQFLDTLDARQKKLLNSSMGYRPYSSNPKAPPMPDQVAEDLVRTGNDIRTQQQNLSQKRAEEVTLRQKFTSDIDRFKQLKGVH